MPESGSHFFNPDAGSAPKKPSITPQEKIQPVIEFISLETGEMHIKVDPRYEPGDVFDIKK